MDESPAHSHLAFSNSLMLFRIILNESIKYAKAMIRATYVIIYQLVWCNQDLLISTVTLFFPKKEAICQMGVIINAIAKITRITPAAFTLNGK